MREREDHVIMVTSQQPPLLAGEPTLGLEIGALGTRPVATRVVPDARHVTVWAGLHMTAEGRRPALHDGARGSADMGGQGMRLLIRGKGVLEDRLQRDERHRCLHTSGLRASSGCFAQYHAHYPRCKRLVVRLQWRLISTVQVRAGVCHTSVAEGYCVTARWGGKQLEANPRSVGCRTRFGGMSRRAFD